MHLGEMGGPCLQEREETMMVKVYGWGETSVRERWWQTRTGETKRGCYEEREDKCMGDGNGWLLRC